MPISSETLKRYAVCILGLFFSAQGVAITKLGALGVSPISSVANVMSLRLPALSLGNWLIIWNCVLILGQILILRRKFQPIQLLQIPLSFLFGYLIFFDFTIQGTREGTLIAALCTGMVIKFFTPRLRQPLERFIGCHRAQQEEISA